MYDQSFNYVSLSKMLKKSDFLENKPLKSLALKEKELETAVARVTTGFSAYNFLACNEVRGKNVYRIQSFSDELILRKIDRNLRKAIPLQAASRDTIISNIKNLISEGVQYKIYRLDIKSFYESFNTLLVINEINAIKKLSPLTKTFIKDILENFALTGGSGLPRGLSLSATLSEILMASFDRKISTMPMVFYYSRYVDDIIILTSGEEIAKQFIKKIGKFLPGGLHLNKKKEALCEAPDSKEFKPTAHNPTNPPLLEFEYLGYRLSVYEPTKKNDYREVILDISSSKINKIKTRLTRAIIDYCKNRNFELLELRLKFLTSNFSVIDINKGSHKLAGIFHNYHRVDFNKSEALCMLDEYLHRAVFSSHGTIFNDFYCKTSTYQRRRLITFSFSKGFKERIYVYFSRSQLKIIQECWKYA